MELNPRGRELLIALCRYVLQHGNVARDAKWAAQLLAMAAGHPIPIHECSNALALAKLHFAKDAIEQARDDLKPERTEP